MKNPFTRFLVWLRGEKCPGCRHRAARHHPSCDNCICSRFGERWGYQGHIVTDPEELRKLFPSASDFFSHTQKGPHADHRDTF